MNLLKTSRKYHKWLMLFLGLQFVIWSITGAYMVFFNIDYIHGDTLVVNHQTKISPQNISVTTAQIHQKYPAAKNISLGIFINQNVYRFTVEGQTQLVNARTGILMSPLNKKQAISAAQHFYTGNDKINRVEFIADNPPFELSRRVHNALPAWRINFDDFASPSLYISAQSGELIAKRHQFWRLFDWMFKFHAMDYKKGDVDSSLLFWFTALGILASIFGLILMYFRVFKDNSAELPPQGAE
jgi:copper/silver efflux system protein